ncbi:MAG: polysaccharide deacetylase family protein [Pseudomonadota bacterium]
MKAARHNVLYLCLHGVGSPPSGISTDERRYWMTGERFDDLLDFVSKHNQSSTVKLKLSFDDANASDLDVVLPRLLARNMTAHFFVPSSFIGLSDHLDADAIRRLAEAGMRIGSHGHRHEDWRSFDWERLRRDMQQSREELCDLVGRNINTIAPPFGHWSAAMVHLAKSVGYEQFFTCNGHAGPAAAFLQHRLVMTCDTGISEFRRAVSRPAVAKAHLRNALAGLAKASHSA